MHVKFHGVRGSVPTPLSPEKLEQKMVDLLVSAKGVDTSTPAAARKFVRSRPVFEGGTVGGNTPCVEVTDGGKRLVIDAGSGLKELGRRLMDEGMAQGGGQVDILMSHTHWDHVCGFPFFHPAFVPGNKINIWGCHTHLKDRFRNQHHEYNFPVLLEDMPADIRFHKLSPSKQKTLNGFSINALKLVHPGDFYAYRLKNRSGTLVYASDASYNNPTPRHMEKYYDFYRNADILIFDAHFGLIESFEKSDWGHSTPFIGVDIAVNAGVKRIVLFHHDHLSDDGRLQELFERSKSYLKHVASGRSCEVILAHDGLELDI